jgi:hypothetical protein
MDVITIETQAYKDLVSRINTIAKFVVEHQPSDTPIFPGNRTTPLAKSGVCSMKSVSAATMKI